jgi:hypothetical protein
MMQSSGDDTIELQDWETIDSTRDIDSDAIWDLIYRLRHLGTRSVLDRALVWCQDSDPYRRAIGALMLAQLGEDARGYPEESVAMIRSMIPSERDDEVITSLISAVHFRGMADMLPWLLSLAGHPSEDVRWRVAWALPIDDGREGAVDRETIETLIRLAGDPEPRVRDWATFSLGMTEADSPEIRQVLLDRLADSDFDTRGEAAVGLAKRKEPRAVRGLADCLMSDRVGELYVEAAELYADPQLKGALVALKRWWDVNPELLDRAIAACS